MIDSKELLITLSATPMDRITIIAEFPHADSERLFDFWTKEDLLKSWWPPVAELRPEKNAGYHFSWPSQNWHLRGTFTDFTRGKSLEFTWKWDHENIEPTKVRLTFDPLPSGGARLTLHHGNYADNAEGKKIRDEHVEGWMYFLGQLQKQVEVESPKSQ